MGTGLENSSGVGRRLFPPSSSVLIVVQRFWSLFLRRALGVQPNAPPHGVGNTYAEKVTTGLRSHMQEATSKCITLLGVLNVWEVASIAIAFWTEGIKEEWYEGSSIPVVCIGVAVLVSIITTTVSNAESVQVMVTISDGSRKLTPLQGTLNDAASVMGNLGLMAVFAQMSVLTSSLIVRSNLLLANFRQLLAHSLCLNSKGTICEEPAATAKAVPTLGGKQVLKERDFPMSEDEKTNSKASDCHVATAKSSPLANLEQEKHVMERRREAAAVTGHVRREPLTTINVMWRNMHGQAFGPAWLAALLFLSAVEGSRHNPTAHHECISTNQGWMIENPAIGIGTATAFIGVIVSLHWMGVNVFPLRRNRQGAVQDVVIPPDAGPAANPASEIIDQGLAFTSNTNTREIVEAILPYIET